MAIPKKVTFEGSKYNLDDKDRVAAGAAVNKSAVSISFAAGAGSISGDAGSGIITVTTQATVNNDITVTFADPPAQAPVCTYITDLSNLTHPGIVGTSTGFTVDVGGNTGTGTLNYVCL